MKVSFWFLMMGTCLISPFVCGKTINAKVENDAVASTELTQIDSNSENQDIPEQTEMEKLLEVMAKATKLYKQGKSSEALLLLETERRVAMLILSSGNILVKGILFNLLGLLYEDTGKYEEAESFYTDALEYSTRLYEGYHPSVATNLGNLGKFYLSQGRYREAELFFQDSLAMLKRLYEGDNLLVATNLNNLAELRRTQGRYREAEPLFQDALAMLKRLHKDDHPGVATILANLGGIYYLQRKYAEAEPFFQDALAMLKRLHKDDHPSVATILNSLGLFYAKQRKYAEAEPLLQDALAMLKRLYKDDHPSVATNLGNLGIFYTDQRKYAEAEPLLQDALAMLKRLHKDDHPGVASGLSNIGFFYQSQAQYPKALNYLTQAAEAEENILSTNLIIGSEQQKKQFLDLFQSKTDQTISFHLNAVPKNRQAAELALTTILRRKGRVLDAMGQTLQTLRDNLDDESEQIFDDLTKAQAQLTALVYKYLPDDPTQRQNIQTLQADLNKEIKTLEAQLSSRSAEFAQTTMPVNISQVQQTIPTNAALVEFIQYRTFNPKKRTDSETRYAVYVLLPNGEMQWQDLGKASIIDDKILRFRKLLSKGGKRGLDAVPTESGIEAIKEIARELDQLLMQPVRGMVGDVTHLLLSPDSQLNTLPFAALVDEQDKYLVENYLITYLTSGRDLLRLQLNQDQETTAPLLLADPTYSSPGILTKTDTKATRRREQ